MSISGSLPTTENVKFWGNPIFHHVPVHGSGACVVGGNTLLAWHVSYDMLEGLLKPLLKRCVCYTIKFRGLTQFVVHYGTSYTIDFFI